MVQVCRQRGQRSERNCTLGCRLVGPGILGWERDREVSIAALQFSRSLYRNIVNMVFCKLQTSTHEAKRNLTELFPISYIKNTSLHRNLQRHHNLRCRHIGDVKRSRRETDGSKEGKRNLKSCKYVFEHYSCDAQHFKYLPAKWSDGPVTSRGLKPRWQQKLPLYFKNWF